MRKIVVLVAVLALALSCLGCSSKSKEHDGWHSISAAAESLTEDQKQEIASFIESDEMLALDAAVDESVSSLSDLVQSGDVDELDRRFLALSLAVQDAEGMAVPAVCEKLYYNKMQTARAVVVALGDYSSALSGSADGEADFDEASEYIGKATEFTKAYETELKRLTELAK